LELINKLPYFYNNKVTRSIQDGLSIESNSVSEKISNTLTQFFVDEATWGLDSWEKMLGISKNNNDIQTRRENIKAKMRSRGTTSIEVIKNICEAYSYGEVDIVVDHANYSFEIHFVGSIGVPQAFAELDKTIAEIKATAKEETPILPKASDIAPLWAEFPPPKDAKIVITAKSIPILVYPADFKAYIAPPLFFLLYLTAIYVSAYFIPIAKKEETHIQKMLPAPP
jgi:hypothetical protein